MKIKGYEPNNDKNPYDIYTVKEENILLFTQIEDGTFVIVDEQARILLFSLEKTE